LQLVEVVSELMVLVVEAEFVLAEGVVLVLMV
jgi:hypothetical protein